MSALDEGNSGIPASDAHPPSLDPIHRDATPSALDFARLADALPRLGTVFWLDRRSSAARSASAAAAAHGLIPLDPALAALGRCTNVSARQAVTPCGPREWLCFHDAGEEVQAKLFLLLDTDYLAWDEMTAACAFVPSNWQSVHVRLE